MRFKKVISPDRRKQAVKQVHQVLGVSERRACRVIEQWRIEYNTIRPHSALGYKTPAPKTVIEQQPQFQPLGLP